MNNEVAMRICDGVAHFDEQRQLGAQVQFGRIYIDGCSVDVLHHQVGLALSGVACVEQTRDSGMSQVGENLALAQEAAAEGRFLAAIAEQLDGDALLDFSIGAMCEV